LNRTRETGADRGMIVIALITSIFAFLALMIYFREVSFRILVVIFKRVQGEDGEIRNI